MPFTNESEVRLLFQLSDDEQVAAALVEACIEIAHEEILRVLDPVNDVQPPKRAVSSAEAFLAGAHTFRALAAHDAVGQRTFTIGGQRVEPGRRFEVLNLFAKLAEDLAHRLIEPYARPGAPRTFAGSTDAGFLHGNTP